MLTINNENEKRNAELNVNQINGSITQLLSQRTSLEGWLKYLDREMAQIDEVLRQTDFAQTYLKDAKNCIVSAHDSLEENYDGTKAKQLLNDLQECADHIEDNVEEIIKRIGIEKTCFEFDKRNTKENIKRIDEQIKQAQAQARTIIDAIKQFMNL